MLLEWRFESSMRAFCTTDDGEQLKHAKVKEKKQKRVAIKILVHICQTGTTDLLLQNQEQRAHQKE